MALSFDGSIPFILVLRLATAEPRGCPTHEQRWAAGRARVSPNSQTLAPYSLVLTPYQSGGRTDSLADVAGAEILSRRRGDRSNLHVGRGLAPTGLVFLGSSVVG